jgi:hypothetical protein
MNTTCKRVRPLARLRPVNEQGAVRLRDRAIATALVLTTFRPRRQATTLVAKARTSDGSRCCFRSASGTTTAAQVQRQQSVKRNSRPRSHKSRNKSRNKRRKATKTHEEAVRDLSQPQTTMTTEGAPQGGRRLYGSREPCSVPEIC